MGWFSGLLWILGTAGVIAVLGSASPTLVCFPHETFKYAGFLLRCNPDDHLFFLVLVDQYAHVCACAVIAATSLCCLQPFCGTSIGRGRERWMALYRGGIWKWKSFNCTAWVGHFCFPLPQCTGCGGRTTVYLCLSLVFVCVSVCFVVRVALNRNTSLAFDWDCFYHNLYNFTHFHSYLKKPCRCAE